MNEGQFATLLERLDRIEALLQPTVDPDPLLPVLAGVFGRNGFTSSEAWAAAQQAASEAETLGQRLPDLPHELQRAGITSTHGLGRYLGSFEGRGVSCIAKDRTGKIWQLDAVISRDDETAKCIQRAGPIK